MKYIILLLVFINILADAIASDENEQNFEFGNYYIINSKYLWRGIVIRNNAVVQPGLWISYKDFNAEVSGNINFKIDEEEEYFDELDVKLSFISEHGKFSVEPGFLLYYYPFEENENITGELFLNLQYTHKIFNLYTNHYLDIINYRNAYFGEFGMNINPQLSKKISYNIGLNTGWSNSHFNYSFNEIDEPAINTITLSQSLLIEVNENFSAEPKMEVISLANTVLKEVSGYENFFVWSVNLSLQF